jgi:hypothetical protein
MGNTRNAYRSKYVRSRREWADNIKVDLLERAIVRIKVGGNYTEVGEGMNRSHRPPAHPRFLH